jgi:hypothetical protein
MARDTTAIQRLGRARRISRVMPVLFALLWGALTPQSARASDVPFTYRTQWGAVNGVGSLENGQLTCAASTIWKLRAGG